MSIYTYDAWVREFKPVANHLRNQNHGLELSYETYGEECDYVKLQDEHNIWTEVDGDFGTYIVSGYHYVNRIHYYITTNPWIEDVEVPTWVYRSCDCMDDEKYEDMGYNPDCPDCEDGTIDIDYGSVVALKDIYGEDAKIVG
jgi:hypothetical protein